MLRLATFMIRMTIKREMVVIGVTGEIDHHPNNGKEVRNKNKGKGNGMMFPVMLVKHKKYDEKKNKKRIKHYKSSPHMYKMRNVRSLY